jgi:hypothetical protein
MKDFSKEWQDVRLIGIFYFLNTIENIYSMIIERKLEHYI